MYVFHTCSYFWLNQMMETLTWTVTYQSPTSNLASLNWWNMFFTVACRTHRDLPQNVREASVQHSINQCTVPHNPFGNHFSQPVSPWTYLLPWARWDWCHVSRASDRKLKPQHTHIHRDRERERDREMLCIDLVFWGPTVCVNNTAVLTVY